MEAKISDAENNFAEKLVELVAKHKILYDSTIEGYTYPHSQEEIWRKIANDLNEEVAACKLKWKNIRSCYTRYLRQITSKNCRVKKKYYLAKHLKFLLPFCKPHSRQVGETCPSVSDDNTYTYCDDLELEPTNKTETSDEITIKLEHEVLNEESNEREFAEDYEHAKKLFSECSDEADMNFFKSLLPDIRQMDGRQKNQLKITILNAIHGILYTSN